MDLDALRKAALSSKKRKLTPQPQSLQVETNHHLPFQNGQREKEEGEIEDESVQVEVNPVVSSRSCTFYHLLKKRDLSSDDSPLLASSTRCQRRIKGHHISITVLRYSSRLFAIDRDFEGNSVGCVRLASLCSLRTKVHELTLHRIFSFSELHLDSSLIPPQLSLSARSTPFQPSQTSLSPSESLNPLPHLAPSFGRESQYYPPETDLNQELNVDYDALEQEKRQKLLARKAALKARNQRQAQSLESELESLFASAPPSVPDSVDEGGERDDLARDDGEGIAPLDLEPSAKRPRHSYAPHHTSPDYVHSLRDSIDHTEEIVEQPISGPFAYNPSFAYPSHNGNNSNNPTSSRRPVATDLEHLPSQRLSQTALSRQRIVGGFAGSLFNGGLASSESMVIDISDDEEDDGVVATTESAADVDMNSANNDESRSSRLPSPDNARLTIPSIPPNNSKGASSTAAQVGEILRKRQLEEKELEIQKIMDRIKDMEERKKRGVSAQTEDGAASGGSAAIEGSSISASIENSELGESRIFRSASIYPS